jgi:hypothetical protein
MTSHTPDTDALGLMAANNPVDTVAVTGPDLEAAMAAAIKEGEGTGQPQRSSTASRIGFGVAIGLTCAAVVTVLIVFSSGSTDTANHSKHTAAEMTNAGGNPHLLVTAPGWHVTRADEYERDSGEMNFSDGQHELQITWYPARSYQTYLDDRASVSTPEHSTLLGLDATTVHYGGSEYATMLAPTGNVFIEIRGDAGDKTSYDALLASLEPVDMETWLAAMPASVVQPTTRAAVVEEMLRDIPLPPGFDVDSLAARAPLVAAGDPAVLDRYQLGAKVVSAVTCDWLDRWVAATEGGDQAAADAAADALSTSRNWHVLDEMAKEGAYPQVLHMLTQQVQDGDLDSLTSSSGTEQVPSGTYETGPAYASALGCDSQYRHRIDN